MNSFINFIQKEYDSLIQILNKTMILDSIGFMSFYFTL